MQCRNCGNIIKDGEMFCRLCLEPVCMVPEYNVQEEMLLHQVSEALEQGEVKVERKQTTAQDAAREAEYRRRKMEHKRRKRKRQRNVTLAFMLLIVFAIIGVSYYLYCNSYAGLVKSGSSRTISGEYESAIEYYEKAIKKKADGIVAYQSLAEIYCIQSKYEEAETILEFAVESNSDNAEFYVLLINFYIEEEEFDKVMPLLSNYSNALSMIELEPYIVYGPEFSLAEGVYDDVREVSLISDGGKILFTNESSLDDVEYKAYDEPIQISSGETIVTAIVENELGITSVPISKKYQVELPIEGAPVVTPSTGQYNSAMQITVQVPVGYQAYYTIDGSIPDESSKIYKEPISMNEGNTVLSVVLINGDGKKSDITKRNYELLID